jgi:hypothetical protein
MFLHHEADDFYKWVNDWNVDTIVLIPPLYFLLWVVARIVDPDAISAVFAVLVALSPLLLPFALFMLFWKRWIHYIRFSFWFGTEFVLLHIELPPEVTKSPAAMELVLTGLHNSGGEGTFIARIWEGKFMAVHSLELVGEAGRISYYLHTRRAFKDFTEARIYGQFPEARITEVEDYAPKVHFTPETHEMWGTEYMKGENNAMPIKTYFDWELNQAPDVPETKIDPLTNIFELMNSLRPGERIWIQILIHAHKQDQWYGFYDSSSKKKFYNEATDAIKTITKNAILRTQGMLGELAVKDIDAAKSRAAERGGAQLTTGESFYIGTIERGMHKLVFDCGIRGLYIADKGKFNGSRIGQMVNFWAPFKAGQSGQGLGVRRGHNIFDYPWQDWNDWRKNLISKQLYFWYKHRSYFYGTPLDQDYFMMTTEELASIWHFPSSQVKTPALERVPSRVSEAPLNLPTAAGPLNLPQ